MSIPSKEECFQLLKENGVPDNIIAHVTAVHDFAMEMVDKLEKKGVSVNRALVAAACLLHDIEKLKPDHESKGAEFVTKKGFFELAPLIRKHGLRLILKKEFFPQTIEERLVFYADKRVKGDKTVTLEERFNDIIARYGKDRPNWIKEEMELAREIEQSIMKETS